MAFAATLVHPPSSSGAAGSGPDAWGGAAVEIWKFTQLNTDGGTNTFQSGLSKTTAVIGSVTTAAANNAKSVGFDHDGAGLISVITDDNGGSEAPTAGYVIVVGDNR